MPILSRVASPRSLIALIVFAGLGLSLEASDGPTFPGETWAEKSPSDFGYDSDKLDRLAELLGGRGCVVKNGYVIKKWGNPATKGNLASSAKPVLSTLLFFAIQERKLAGPDAKVRDFGWDLLDKDAGMTFAQLANMTSGYARPEPPGAAWAYNDFAIQLYQKTLFDRVFADDPERIAASRFASLGLEDGLAFDESRRRQISSNRDFARIAWLWLNKGNWNGKQILDRRFFDEYQRPHVPHLR